eukprot:gnl/TRDRNA2_/TRDRNA2_83353_c2_seq1.p1 gnl/TRDRNA2_/TRDRNA2_83353_c2~~gnl/TRDRNA2_/TRDRNA2_83353_c2_seq1.p1  ORF type:complete len:234 (+),score=41.80 gnl/TRDRNA2_/TRDRNA2_83353_c2_seq1:37-702(+)
MPPVKLQFGKQPGISVGCEPQCGALLDTGTSLITVPDAVYNKIYDQIKGLFGGVGKKCDVQKLPDLVLNIAGHEYKLPPSAYVSATYANKGFHESAPGETPKSAPTKSLDVVSTNSSDLFYCELAIMKLGDRKSQFGPLFIIGMPWFRQYYTMFNLGKDGKDKRTVHVTEANAQCDPLPGASFATIPGRRREDTMTMKHVDFSKAWLPHWLGRDKNATLEI